MNPATSGSDTPEPGRADRGGIIPSGLKTALLLAVLLFVLSIGHAVALLQLAIRDADTLSVTRLVTSATDNAQAISWPIVLQMSGFLAAALLVHLLFGVWTWWIARGLHRWRGAPGALPWRTVLAVFLAWTISVLFANAGQFPRSVPAQGIREIARTMLGPIAVWQLIVLAVAATALPAFLQLGRALAARPRIAATTAVVLLAVVAWDLAPSGAHARAADPHGRPNIIFIGVDALRLPNADPFGGHDTPHIGAFLKDGFIFQQAYTPLARTFASWSSILTGEDPVHSGIRFNLMPDDAFVHGKTLADDLRDAGYRTVYATDEVRFSYIDESFGFDQVIAPPKGAPDLLLTTAFDMPMVNLMVNTAAGRVLFPNFYGNRAAGKVYEPETFEHLVWHDLEIPSDRPLFLATHFTLPHWPVFWAEGPYASSDVEYSPEAATEFRDKMFVAAIRAADEQVGRYLDELKAHGLLDDAIVVILSDHGESLAQQDDLALRTLVTRPGSDVEGVTVRLGAMGHGTSVTAPVQFRCLLGFRRYGGDERWTGGTFAPVSTIDIAPTIRDLVGIGTSGRPPDGLDLTPLLRDQDMKPDPFLGRILFTETGFNPPAMYDQGGPNAERVAAEGAMFFKLDPATGRIGFLDEVLPKLVDSKERAAIQFPWTLAAVPTTEGPVVWFLYNSVDGRWGRYPEDASALPDAPGKTLEAALMRHFKGELAPPAPWPDSLLERSPPVATAP